MRNSILCQRLESSVPSVVQKGSLAGRAGGEDFNTEIVNWAEQFAAAAVFIVFERTVVLDAPAEGCDSGDRIAMLLDELQI